MSTHVDRLACDQLHTYLISLLRPYIGFCPPNTELRPSTTWTIFFWLAQQVNNSVLPLFNQPSQRVAT